MGVKTVNLARGVVLQFDAALLGKQVQDDGIDGEFGFRDLR